MCFYFEIPLPHLFDLCANKFQELIKNILNNFKNMSIHYKHLKLHRKLEITKYKSGTIIKKYYLSGTSGTEISLWKHSGFWIK